MKTFKRIAKRFTFLLLLLPLTACAISGDPLDGKVLDEGTNQPIPGAIVVVRWQGNNWGALVHSQGVCYHVETAVTDQNGNYRTPEWSDASSGFFINNRYITKDAYKPGYVFGTKLPEEKIVWMVPFKGTKEERLKNMGRGFGFLECGSPEEYRKQLEPLARALYEEAKSLATTDKESEIADGYLTGWETMKFGSEVADQRREQRRLERLKEKR